MLLLQVALFSYAAATPPSDTVERKKFEITFSTGVSFPTSAFGNKSDSLLHATDLGTVTAGYAKPGFYFRLSGSTLLTNWLGARLTLGDDFNGFDLAAFERTENLPASETSVSGYYRTGVFLLGPFASAQLSDALTLEFAIMGGTITSSCPTIYMPNGAIPDYTGSYIMKTGTTIGYNISLSMSYLFNANWSLGLSADYAGTIMHYPGTDAVGPASSQSTDSKVLSLGLLHIGLLVSYSF